jgi:hypothetical protein
MSGSEPARTKSSLQTKEFFRTFNVLPFSCTHLALWRGKRPKVHAKQKGFKNFFTSNGILSETEGKTDPPPKKKVL